MLPELKTSLPDLCSDSLKRMIFLWSKSASKTLDLLNLKSPTLSAIFLKEISQISLKVFKKLVKSSKSSQVIFQIAKILLVMLKRLRLGLLSSVNQLNFSQLLLKTLFTTGAKLLEMSLKLRLISKVLNTKTLEKILPTSSLNPLDQLVKFLCPFTDLLSIKY